MPAELKARLDEAASGAKRSLTAEIVARLEGSFTEWPKVTLPPEVAARVEAGSPTLRRLAEERVQMMAEHVVEQFYPPDRPVVSPEAFYQAGVDALPKLPDGERGILLNELLALARKIAGDPKWTPPDPNVPF